MANKGEVRKKVVTSAAALDAQLLNELSLRLLAYARRRSRIWHWWSGEAGNLAKGHTIEDAVCEAMGSLFGGLRKWNPETEPDVWNYLKSAVNSILSNLSRSADNRRTSRDGDEDVRGDGDTPESQLLDRERRDALAARRDRGYSLLIDEFGDDEDLVRLYDLIVEHDIHRPTALSERMGLSVREVNNLKKRFWRACIRVIDILEKDDANE